MKLPKLPRLTSDHGRRQKVFSILLGLAVGLAFFLVYLLSGGDGGPFARKSEQFVLDAWTQTFHGRSWKSVTEFIDPEAARKIALVVVDDQTLERGFPWPLPRDRYLDAIRRLEKAGARTIALDILFGGPSPDSVKGSTELSPRDQVLREALARPSVVIPYTLKAKGSEMLLSGVYPPLLDGWSEEDIRRRMGFTMVLPDSDEKVRRASLAVDELGGNGTSENVHYSFNVVALAHFLRVPPGELLARLPHVYEETRKLDGSDTFFSFLYSLIQYHASDLVTVGELDPEAAERAPGFEYIQAAGEKRAERAVHALSEFLTVVPLFEILEAPEDQLPGYFGSVEDPETGQERPVEVLALFGVTVSGGYDLKVSPIGPISGVAIHANVLLNLLQGDFQRKIPFGTHVAILLGSVLFATLVGSLLEIRVATVVFVSGLVGYVLLSYWLFTSSFRTGSFLLPTAVPLVAALASFGMVTVYNVRAQKVAKDQFAKILQEVAPIPDLESLLGKDGLKVGSEERILTILFSDIRGYTDLSESLDAVTVTEMLNTYHGAMGEIFDRYGGVVFDYQGDAQMVVFGLVPASQPNHAAAACKAGVGMVLRLEKLRQEWQSQGRPVFETGVGVCTGPVAIGVLGSAQRKQYAAIGDPTNTAARMQGKSKDLDSPVLITQSTFEAAGDEIIADFIEAVRVKGKREPLQVYGVNIQAMEEKMGVHA